MKIDPPDKSGGFLYKTIYVRTRYIILNKLGDKRTDWLATTSPSDIAGAEIGRASCRERV